MGSTANSLIKERTFYVKLRNYLECNAPQFGNVTDAQYQGVVDRAGLGWRANDTVSLWEENDQANHGNRVNALVDFGTTIKDWSNSYNNGIWTVPTNKKYNINISLKLQHAISLMTEVYDQGVNDEPFRTNGGLSGYITLYKIPASSTQGSIPDGEIITHSGISPYSNINGIQNLSRTHFGVVYNQDQGGGSGFQGNNGNANRGSGTGSAASTSPGGNNDILTPATIFTYPKQFPVPLYWSGSQSGGAMVNDPTTAQNLADKGEFYKSSGSFYNLESVTSNDNRINSFHTPKTGNEYTINYTNSFDIGDRIFVVVSALYAEFAATTNLIGNSIPINNNKREGGILYQWTGGIGGNQPTLSLGHLILQNGTFTAKSIL
jgi:hypothetical protein